jgi:hypothetical protein
MSRVIALMHHMLPAQRTAVRTRVAAVVEQLKHARHYKRAGARLQTKPRL